MKHPNILLLWTDEQRHDTLPVAGTHHPDMPELARLSGHSCAFTRAYCTQPVCTPARGSVMTGLMPHRHGAITNNVALDPSVPCLPELLPERVYATGYIGKWHLGDECFAQHGFEEWVGVDDSYVRYYSPERDRNHRCEYHHWLVSRGYRPDHNGIFGRHFAANLPESESKPAFQADQAIDFIDRHRGEPWCLSVNMLEPHMPFTGPRDGDYDPQAIPLPDNHLADPDDSCFLRHRLLNRRFRSQSFSCFDFSDEAGWRRLRANYYGLCSQIDHHFGRILRALEASGQYDDTLVIFTSDHGDMMGSHRMVAKTTMYEEATRIPLLVKLPGQRSHRRCEHPVSQIDLVPTALEACGVAIPDDIQGQSLVATAAGAAHEHRDVLVQWTFNKDQDFTFLDGEGAALPWAAGLGDGPSLTAAWEAPMRTLITDDGWRYSANDLGEQECFHLASDPGETRNLAGSDEAPLDELHSRLLARMDDLGDELSLPWL
jgi:arylsulfatase A-like enzyme